MSILPSMVQPARSSAPVQEGWRNFELLTKVTLNPDYGASKVWVPIPNHVPLDYQRPGGTDCKGNYTKVGIFREPVYGCEVAYAEWETKGSMLLEVVSRVSVRDRSTDLHKPHHVANLPEDVSLYLKGTPSSPTDGIVLMTARRIVGSLQSPIAKAEAVYNWILENGVRDPNVTGCGTGDIVSMLESGNISGKCADLNGLFVALVRALGVPARDVYGIRVSDSRYFKSLGKAADITKAQHCKAEFHVSGLGWIPVDPADVLKVALEEKLAMESPQVISERTRQFGSWEGNWITYNTARDVKLYPPAKADVEFLMYPRGETEKGVLNHLDPKGFRYEIISREIQA